MAILNNFNAIQNKGGINNRPVVTITFNLYGDNSTYWNVNKFQYVLKNNRKSYVSNNVTYLSNWNIIGAFQSNLYVKITRNTDTNITINVHQNELMNGDSLVCSGSGEIETLINLTQNNSSGVTGTVYRNSNLLFDNESYITLTDDTNWVDATSVSSSPFVNLQPSMSGLGRGFTYYWNIYNDLPSEVNSNYQFRFLLTPQSGNQTTLMKGKDVVVFKQVPSFNISSKRYTNKKTYPFYFNNITGTSITQYRVSETESGLYSSSWSTIQTVVENDVQYKKGQITWSNNILETKILYVEITDDYYNRSNVCVESIIYTTTVPFNTYLNLVGTTKNSYYTGVVIDDNKNFDVDNSVTVEFYAECSDPNMILEYSLSGDIKSGYNVSPNFVVFDPLNSKAIVKINGGILNDDNDKEIRITFRDEAENTTVISKKIRYNTKIYRFAYPLLNGQPNNSYIRNIKEPNSAYDILLTERTLIGTTLSIARRQIFAGQYVRNWNDIFYPESHRYPVLADGYTIDVNAAKAMNGVSNELYDAVLLDSSKNIVYDTEGRVTTVNWTKNGSKNYENFESSPTNELRYWVIDNGSYGAINLTFEHFYIDSNKYGPPYNKQSPYGGDCVVIYDASADGCVETKKLGSRYIHTIKDSSKLVELYAYTGIGDKVFNLNNGASVNANTNGGFNVPSITTTSKICIILYSDASVTSYGFKLKAGPRYEQYWSNFDIDYNNGELWLHKYPTGNSSTNRLRAVADYYDTKIMKDYDEGSITFEVKPSGVITADYTYYDYNVNDIVDSRLFASYNDDFVEYMDVDTYVSPNGVIPNKNIIYNYDISKYKVICPSGKLVQHYTWDKDRGIVEFLDATKVIPNNILPSGIPSDKKEFAFVPQGRLFSDYNYHTYLRLTNDGYGNFTFYDDTLVADNTPQYPDYTYADMKIVNEGNVVLEDGMLRFLARGFMTGESVNQVIDINRPWDIQQGSSAETYMKCSVEIKQNYTWASTCSKLEAQTILSSWMNKGFGINVYPQQTIYGRCVWVLGGASGSVYPTTTAGKKIWSAEVSGKFYQFQT